MDALAALADPTRRRIVELLADRSRTAGELAAAFEISRPAVSRHLRVLREAELVTSEPQAQRRVYRLRSAAFDDLATWLDGIRGFWSDRLDDLEAELDGIGRSVDGNETPRPTVTVRPPYGRA